MPTRTRDTAHRVTRRLRRIAREAQHRSARLLRNASYRARGAPDGLPIPPAHLRSKIGAVDLEAFFRSDPDGQTQHLVRLVGARAVAAGGPYRLLDFGCGIGRVERQLRPLQEHADVRIHGTDIDEAMIRWCDEHLPFGHFAVNGPAPPLPIDASSVDFVFALTVLTHLSLEHQRAWIAELSRVLTPGGLLYFTVRGPSYAGWLTPDERTSFERDEPVIRHAERSGEPSGYQECITFHPPAFVRDDLCRGWEPVELRAGRADEMDVHVYRKGDAAPA